MRNTNLFWIRELLSDYQKQKRALAGTLVLGSKSEIMRKVLEEGKPHFNTTYDHAMRIMNTMITHGKPCPVKGLRRPMWIEFSELVRERMRRKRCTLTNAVTYVLVEKRASRYYLSMDRFYRILAAFENHKILKVGSINSHRKY